MTKPITARIAADLIVKVRREEGWTKVEGGQLADIQRMNELYTVTIDRERQCYVATRKD